MPTQEPPTLRALSRRSDLVDRTRRRRLRKSSAILATFQCERHRKVTTWGWGNAAVEGLGSAVKWDRNRQSARLPPTESLPRIPFESFSGLYCVRGLNQDSAHWPWENPFAETGRCFAEHVEYGTP